MRARIQILIGVCGLVALACALSGGQADAQQQPRVQVSVDKDQVAVGEVFRLQVKVEGGEVSAPVVEPHDALDINTENPTQSARTMTTSIVQGNVYINQEMTWVYRVVARQAGTHQLPPVRVEVNGEIIEGNIVEVQVHESDVASPPGRPSGPTVDDAILIESEVNKQRVYQGEQVNLTLRLLQIDIRNIVVRTARRGNLPLPSTEGFYTGPITDATLMDSRNGYDYLVREFVQPLYPTRPGVLEIGPWNWQGYIEGRTQVGFQQVFREYETEPIQVEVLPLPERPPGASGAVGRFEVAVDIDGALQQGIPDNLVVTITGQGNPDAVNNPRLPNMPWAHLSSPDTTVRRLDSSSWRQFEKAFTYNLTALEVGSFEVPAIAFTYFSPEEEAYVTAESGPALVEVRPSAESTALVTAGGNQALDQIEILGDDVFSIITSAGTLQPQRSRTAGTVALFLLPPILYVGAFALMRHRRHLQENPAYARSRRAHARYLKRLEHVADAEDPSLAIHHTLLGYITDKLNVQDKGFTAHDVKPLLIKHEAPETLADQVDNILRTCERKRYSGAQLTEDEIAALKTATRSVVQELEDCLKQGK